jgi:predicted nicotinamide N-methyase
VEIETTARDLLGEPLDGFDAILLGDMFYEAELAGRVRGWLSGQQNKTTLMGSPDRGHVDPGQWTALKKYAVPADVDGDGSHFQEAVVYTTGTTPRS